MRFRMRSAIVRIHSRGTASTEGCTIAARDQSNYEFGMMLIAMPIKRET